VMEYNYPQLRDCDVDGARLFSCRERMIEELGPKNAVVGEVGVDIGEFTEHILNVLHPSAFRAFDIFTAHQYEIIRGVPSHTLFKGKTHRAFYEQRFAQHPEVATVEGLASDTLCSFPEKWFDLLYIDANHRYEFVKSDVASALPRLKDNGLLIFNDYILWSHEEGYLYGVVPVVNDLIVNGGWKVVGFCFDKRMYCDIALQRR
jgi:Methyltransferase domain